MKSIAIDGPSGVGKSTVARKLAQKLGYLYIDTGAMFRGIGVFVVTQGIDPGDERAVVEAIDSLEVSIDYPDGEQHVTVNGEDVTERLRTEDVSRAASVVSQYAPVRSKVLELERKLAEKANVIMDGRDIGTVVLPQATLKLFLTATPEVQAKRRFLQLQTGGKLGDATYESILADIRERDYRDSHRTNAPLMKAPDAVAIDTSELTIEEVLAKILECYSGRS